jgi:hypothetical protein
LNTNINGMTRLRDYASVVEDGRVAFPADIPRIGLVDAEVADMPEGNAPFGGAGAGWFDAFPEVEHPADIIKVALVVQLLPTVLPVVVGT